MAGQQGKGSVVAKSLKSPGRQERLAAALRENLKRRKAQARTAAVPAGKAAEASSGQGSPAAEAPSPRPKPARKPG